MQLARDDIREFMDIWSDQFHETITEEAAMLSASMLLDIYWLLASQGDDEDS